MKGSVRLRNDKYSYYFKYKDEYGKWKTKEKGGFRTKKEAETALRKALVDFEESNYIAKASEYTLGQMIDYYFEHVGEISLRYESIKLYKKMNRCHVVSELGNLKLDKVTPAVLQAFFTNFQKRYSKSTVKVTRTLLSNTLNLAVKQGLLKQNPLKAITLASIKKEKKETRALSEEERERIFSEVENTRYHSAFTVALYTGLRRGEVAGLTWDDVDFESNTIAVNKQLQVQNSALMLVVTKTETSNRILQMPQKLHAYLKSLKQEQDERRAFYGEHYYQEKYFVCAEKDGRPISPDVLTDKAYLLKKKLNIDFKFHDLRHTHATMMLEADANIKVLQERLGHSDIGTTLNTYSHVTKKLEDQAIERFNTFF